MAEHDLALVTPGTPDGAVALFLDMYGATGATEHERAAHARQRLARMLASNWQVTELRSGQTVIGFALWVDLAEYVFVRSFAIDPAWRARGLGARFFARLRAEVFPRGIPVRIEVTETGPHAFWRRLGFSPRTTGMWLDTREVA